MPSTPSGPPPDARPPALLVGLDRRTFLGSSLAAAAALAAAPLLPGCRSAPPEGERFSRLHFLTPAEGNVLERFAARILPAHPPRPTVEETELVVRLDRELGRLAASDPDLGRGVRRLLRVLEYGPFFIGFHFRPFTRLADGGRDAYLAAWETHRSGRLRMAFASLRAFCVFFYLSDERTWESIRYAGPWVDGGAARLRAYREAGA